MSRPLAQGPRSEWRGNARFAALRRIGEGGMGVVYEAMDRERGHAVAVKTLNHFDPAALYRFKQEFRTLADVVHPNLVRLHELVLSDDEQAFFTMELVGGTDFRTYVRQGDGDAPQASSVAPTQAEEPTRSLRRTEGSRDAAAQPAGAAEFRADLGRLRHALRQLVLGIQALHGAGKLHRDIKPSNVLVTPEGRAVVLDFGVSTELSRVFDENLAEPDEFVGTISYMSPEQALSEKLTPASDWYSVGVVLYEALVGRLPFVGTSTDVLTMKTVGDPVPPSERVRGIPPDLDSLCRDLLSRDAEKRPDAPTILRRLGGGGDAASTPSLIPGREPGTQPALVGRERQMLALRAAFGQVVSGRSITIRISGASGMGKSAVAAAFLDELVEAGAAVVLRGRAYERESVPYKAVDSLVDALTRHLIHLDEQGDGVPVPDHVASLARIFPVLRGVPSLADVEDAPQADPRTLRRSAFSALRALLGALAARRPLVLFIDDVQWGDTDSAALLADLVRPPEPPPILLLMTHRGGESLESPFLAELRARWPEGAEARDVEVGPLDAEESRRLALAWLGESGPLAERRARAAARESRGSPFLVEELVRSNLATGPEGDTLAVLTLDEIVAARLARLPPGARRLLEVVAVGGRPLPVSIAVQASELRDTDDAIALLRARRLLRAGLRDGKEFVEPSHDRFRETIVAQLPVAQIRGTHGRLAQALEASPGADPEALAMHWLGADDVVRARRYLERAADRAFDQLAFEQAARLFELAIRTVEASPDEARPLRARLAKVLAWSGRSEAAARAYLEAAEGAPALERAELERAAAIELFASGRLVEGEAVLHRVLEAVGLRAPRSTLGAVLMLLWYRLRIAIAYLFGLRFEERAPGDVPTLARARIDAVYAAATGFAFSNVILGTCMGARNLVMALRAGDRFQILRAAAAESTQHAAMGGKPGGLERKLVEIARRLADRLVEPASARKWNQGTVAQAFSLGSAGVGAYLRGEWRTALALLEESTTAGRVHDHSAGRQADAHVFASWSLNFLGRHRELARRHARHLADAEARGDRYTSVQLRDGSLAIVWLAQDDPDGARRSAVEAMALWPKDRYLLQHWHRLYGEAEIELYVGDGVAAYARVRRDERALGRSLLLTVQHMRVQTAFLRGRAAIASLAVEPAQRAARLVEARRIARRLEREKAAWSAPFASILRAAVAGAEGDRERAAACLREAIARATTADMTGYAIAARFQLGRLLGGDEGRAMTEEAERAMVAEGIRVPARFASTLVPGRWTSLAETTGS